MGKFILFALLSGCVDATITLGGKDDTGASIDNDADGYVVPVDCNDKDATVNPGATEIWYDGVDQNCDGALDFDQDGDGYEVAGYGEDCDDTDAAVNPDAIEACDGIDNDCDGSADGADAMGASVWYADADSDGYGDAAATLAACDQPDGYVADATDCDDADASASPAGTEACNGLDDDCDGATDESDASDAGVWYADADSDGYGDAAATLAACDQPAGYAAIADDCDDQEGTVNPLAFEICNGVDDDCDGTTDEDDAFGTTTWYADADSDGYGDAAVTVTSCDVPAGYVADATDCDDADASASPAGTEACNGLDDDCDGATDESDASDAGVWYADADLDGYGDVATGVASCAAPAGFASDGTDCDDADGTTYPGAEESCADAADRNCDGFAGATDSDGDGFAACEDCGDGDPAVNPDAIETCNGIDDDCDGTSDESDAVDAATWYADADSDGYGDAATALVACDQPAGYVANAGDCYDLDGTTNPSMAVDSCNGFDDDCDGAIDEDAPVNLYYEDADGDGYGGIETMAACEPPAGYELSRNDCDDADASVSPDAIEACDGIDNDCDGATDESGASGESVWYMDADRDGYGVTTATTQACDQPAQYVANADDCNDANGSINPGASEVCGDGADNDCDGGANDASGTTWYGDTDADGYGASGAGYVSCFQPSGTVADATDCDDHDAGINPGAAEVCDGADDDCDGATDESDAIDAATWYADADSDGYGDAATTLVACDQPAGYVADATDCDVTTGSVSPGAAESCNLVDDDCDGDADEDFDADGDGYASAAACAYGDDCDDADAFSSPDGREISLDSTGIDDLCSDGNDNDCDGNADAADWDCQDDEGVESPDGILNGIDNLVVVAADTICMVGVNDAFASPWDGYGTTLQGDNWGAWSAVNTAYSVPLTAYADADGDGADDTYAWCVDVNAYGSLGTGYWKFRLVSQFAADGTTAAGSTCSTASASTTWVPLDLSAFCDWAADDYCGNKTGSDGCGDSVGDVVEVYYSRGTISPP